MLEGWAVQRDQFERDGDLDFEFGRLDGKLGDKLSDG
jgi:hypothetical protein